MYVPNDNSSINGIRRQTQRIMVAVTEQCLLTEVYRKSVTRDQTVTTYSVATEGGVRRTSE